MFLFLYYNDNESFNIGKHHFPYMFTILGWKNDVLHALPQLLKPYLDPTTAVLSYFKTDTFYKYNLYEYLLGFRYYSSHAPNKSRHGV